MANNPDITRYFEVAKKLTLEAGKWIANVDEKDKVVQNKVTEQDLVTNFDHKIEEFLIDNLASEFPDHKFIAEEQVAHTNVKPELTDAPTWLIDPIDGTVNFVHSFPQFCISVGLAICKEIVIGIVYNPTNCELYTAVKNGGAFLNDKPIHVSNATELKKSMVIFEMDFKTFEHTDIAVGRIVAMLQTAQATRDVGSAALALAYVASGIVDCYQIDGLQPWDVAAGVLIVLEAGGTLLDSKGGPYNLMKPNTVAASTCQLACEVSKLIVDTDLKTQRKRLQRT
ncbi:hypothetical protein KPH14_005958 [Odynerus spinipes]|uniref:Inositol-1-monophosphatase n=1 Tax=Odynerus spinipes TaxID=1348599 RepID=A0AAD9RJR1_9HYME|nr:hypothetical protein KPH14_005958 [Odynerus spinipes]